MARKRKAPIRSSTEAASKKLATKDSDVEQDPSPCKADNIESCIFEAESDNDEKRTNFTIGRVCVSSTPACLVSSCSWGATINNGHCNG